jgi:hypothetical protein
LEKEVTNLEKFGMHKIISSDRNSASAIATYFGYNQFHYAIMDSSNTLFFNDETSPKI